MNKLLLTILFIITLQLILSIRVKKTISSLSKFCWSHKYNRGEGIAPRCIIGKPWGLKCYEDCAEGLEQYGEGCRTKCPDSRDWQDESNYCRIVEYTRPGFPVKYGELTDKGMFQRCESTYGVNSCEKFLSTVYPKCPQGFKSKGCCTCEPSGMPDCAKYGLGEGVSFSCKKIYSEKKAHSPKCAATQNLDGGKCYSLCKTGYEGLGNICYSGTPAGWVQCGLGHAANEEECKKMNGDDLFKLYREIYRMALMAISNTCKGLCNAKIAMKEIIRLLETIGESKIEMQKDIIKALKHGTLLKTLYEKAKAALSVKIPSRLELEAVVLIAENLINTFDPSLFVNQILSKYPICLKE